MTEVGKQFLAGQLSHSLSNFLSPDEVGEAGAKLVESATTASVWYLHEGGGEAFEIPNESSYENIFRHKK